MELGAGGGAQVYGGSNATSTFGSHIPESTSSQPSVQVHSDGLNQYHTSVAAPLAGQAGSNTPQLGGSTMVAYGGPALAASAPSIASHGTHVPVQATNPVAVASNGVGYSPGAHTPVLVSTPVPSGPGTPVPASAHGAHTPVLAALYGPASSGNQHTPMAAHTPLDQRHTPVMTGQHPPTVSAVSGSSPAPGYQSQSPVPAGLDMPPHVFAGSQSSMLTGSQTPVFGSQTLSLLSGSQTPPMSHASHSPISQNLPPHHMNTYHYHQLLETQRHAPNSLPDRAVGAESTPL
jgi:hypothetical protein